MSSVVAHRNFKRRLACYLLIIPFNLPRSLLPLLRRRATINQPVVGDSAALYTQNTHFKQQFIFHFSFYFLWITSSSFVIPALDHRQLQIPSLQDAQSPSLPPPSVFGTFSIIGRNTFFLFDALTKNVYSLGSILGIQLHSYKHALL